MPAPVVEALLTRIKQVETQQDEIAALADKLDADLRSLDTEIKSLDLGSLDPADRRLLIQASVELITKSLTKAAEARSRRQPTTTPASAPVTGGFPRLT